MKLEIDQLRARIPYANSANGKRVEVRFGDASGNPYFYFYHCNVNVWYRWIKNKIHPGEAMDKDLYDLPESKLKVYLQFLPVSENL